ncbi:hypothetical protein BBFL7_00009 [Flavobacteria bacterium BBFL7]|nr:hypothetical protein BBFL7_00009 [Flavobacteria bacterium BBFL7]
MSYDLMVFNPKTAPKSEYDFLEWYGQQTEWGENHSYDDPKITSIELKNWFMEMITDFPAMNGPHAPIDIDDRIDDEEITDYSIGKDMIYSGFKWSMAEKVYPRMLELAKKHKVGFYNASGDGKIYMPDKYDNYREVKAHNKKKFSFGGISNYKELIEPSWNEIHKVITKLDGENISFLILENEKGDYLQCLGNSHKMTIEYRYEEENDYKHTVLGKMPTVKKETIIKTSTGEITIYENEIFDMDELTGIIRSFYEKNEVNNDFHFRNR